MVVVVVVVAAVVVAVVIVVVVVVVFVCRIPCLPTISYDVQDGEEEVGC